MATRLGADFDKVSVAAGVSNIGDGVFGAALPLLVATLTRDPMLVAGATLAGRLPWFLFALLSGALVDRLDRRRVMIITDVLRAAGVGVVAWGVYTGRVDLVGIYLLAFGLGVAETFFDTSAEAFVPRLVSADLLPAANGRLQGVEWVGGAFIGPPLGAFLFTTAAALPFIFDAGSFALAALLVALVPGVFRSERERRTSVGEDIGDGLRWLWGQRVVRTLAMMAGVTNMFSFGIIAVFVLYAQDVLGVNEAGYGFLLSALGVGGLLGALVAPRIVSAVGPGNTLRLSLVTQIVVTATFGFTANPWLAGLLMTGYGFLITAWNVVAVSLRQSLTPDRMRGRVAGAARLVAWGTQPLGAFMGGAVAAAYGLRAPFFVAAVSFVVATALVWGIVSNRAIEDAKAA